MKPVRDRRKWHDRLKAVGREAAVLCIALAVLDERLASDPSTLTRIDLVRADRANAGERLGATYLIRLVAQFEGAVRSYWRYGAGRKSVPKLKPLIDSIASRHGVPPDLLSRTHDVREARNAAVHQDGRAIDGKSVTGAARILNRFLARLPPRW